jgi:3-oxoadipate enol-lactonase
MRTVSTSSGTFNIAIDGAEDAPWLVLSHSLGATLDMWRPQVEAFAKRFRVLRYDTRGHGRSGVPAGEYTLAQLGNDVLALLDAVGAAQAAFCGLSLGGATGLWLATHDAGRRITSFVLCDTLPWLGPPEAIMGRMETVRRDGLGPLVDATMERWFTADFREREPAIVARTRADFLATPIDGYIGCCAALRDYDERAHLPRIDRPVLVVAGTHDPSPPPAAARDYASRIRGAQFIELPAAHLTNVGATAEFNERVLTFLATAT